MGLGLSNSNKTVSDKDFLAAVQGHFDKSAQTNKIIEENKELNALVQNKNLKNKSAQLEKSERLQRQVAEQDVLGRAFDKSRMLQDIEDRKRSVTFINPELSKHFILAPHSLFLVTGMTNNGKSTFVAHVAAALVKEQKKVLVLSNEEFEQDFFARVACLIINISFGDYKASTLTSDQNNSVVDAAEKLSQSGLLTVVSTNDDVDSYRVNTVEGVITTLKQVNNRVDCVLLDYYQNVSNTERGISDPWNANNLLASELNSIKWNISFPVIVMAQCKGIQSTKEDKASLDFESNHPMYRWKGGQKILEVATDIVELVRDFDNSCSHLFMHKIRFSHGGIQRGHVLAFDKKMQRYQTWTPEFDLSLTKEKLVRRERKKELEFGMDKIFDETNN